LEEKNGLMPSVAVPGDTYPSDATVREHKFTYLLTYLLTSHLDNSMTPPGVVIMLCCTILFKSNWII